MADGPAKPPSDDASVLRLVGAATTVGFEFLAAILLPGALGYWLDGRFGALVTIPTLAGTMAVTGG